jgi:hypothetical protein
MRDRADLVVVVTAALVAILVLVGAVLLVRRDEGEVGSSVSRPEADPSCELMRPDGLSPRDWFESDGTLVLTDHQAVGIAVALGMGSALSGDAGKQIVSDRLVVERSEVELLTSEQQRALDALDRSVREDCPG